MDPVGTTASVFTLLEAANKVRKTLIRLRHASDELLALNNEVADLQLCIVSHLSAVKSFDCLLIINRRDLKS